MNNLSIEIIELITKYCSNSKDKANLCKVNKLFYSIVIQDLYSQIIIKGPRNYSILKETIKNLPYLKNYIKRLDLSSYTTKGSHWSDIKSKSIIQSNELSSLIFQCKNLKEIRIGDELLYLFDSFNLIQSILNHKELTTIDFTGFCNQQITNQYFNLNQFNWSISNKLENISFFMCMSLKDDFFKSFFKSIHENRIQLKKIDLSFTQIKSDTFIYLNHLNSLTHLNLQNSYSLNCCSPLIDLIESNPLIELNLNFEKISTNQFCNSCLYRILSTLKSNQNLNSLHLIGHSNLNRFTLNQFIQSITLPIYQLKFLSLSNQSNSILKSLLNLLPNLNYIHLSKSSLPYFLLFYSNIKVIEYTLNSKLLNQINSSNFKSIQYGKRSFYIKSKEFIYSKKLILLDHQPLSPMHQYWSYSY